MESASNRKSDVRTAYDVLISEVGPRDGLQSVNATMPTADKLRWIDARYAAGPVSASAAHSLANVRKTPAEMVEEVRAISDLRREIAPHVLLEAGISTAFGCTLQGHVAEDDVIRLAVQCVAAGADESGLSDTVGYANPAQVHRLFKRLRAELGAKAGAAHMHNTRGLGLANCLAAYEEGVRTGIDLEKIIAARVPLTAGLPGEPLYGMTPEAGLPKSFVQGFTQGLVNEVEHV